MNDRFSSHASPRRRAASLLLLLTAIILGADPGEAQTPLDRVREFAAASSGFTLREDMGLGSLSAGGQTTVPLMLWPDTDYMIVGSCDPSCTNLDLFVLDPTGEEVESDRLPDAQPVLLLRPIAQGVFNVVVDMVDCASDACDFAVGILEGVSREGTRLTGRTMEERLSVFRSDLLDQGFTEVGFPQAGTAGQDREIRFPLTLTAGLEYKIVGVCDNSCEDLNLVLVDRSGMEVASDLLPDPYPLLTVVPTVSGEYRVAGQMVTCTVEPCGFLVSTFVSGGESGGAGVSVTGTVRFRDTYQGTLEAGDEKDEEGSYVDTYTVQAGTGQTLVLDLRSPDFDTYLFVTAPGGDQEENDDWGEDTMHSHIEWVVPEGGDYLIRVTSFAAGEVGAYTLQVAVVGGR